METKKIPKPIGDFILKNATHLIGSDGAYYHYTEVVKLLKLYEQKILNGDIHREGGTSERIKP